MPMNASDSNHGLTGDSAMTITRFHPSKRSTRVFRFSSAAHKNECLLLMFICYSGPFF